MAKFLFRDTRKPTKSEIVGGIILLMSILLFLVYHIRKIDKEQRNLMLEFQDINQCESYVGVVKGIHNPERLKKSFNIVFVTMMDGRKYRIHAKKNSKYPLSGVGQILDIGDTVIKRIELDSIYIQKSKSDTYLEYGFELYE